LRCGRISESAIRHCGERARPMAPEKARRRREVAQTLQRFSADDRLRDDPHPVPRAAPTYVGCPGGSSLSLADALRRRPRRHLHRLHRNLALGNLAPDVAGLTVKSPTVSERTAPSRSLITSSSSQLPCASQEPSSSRRSSPLPSSPCCPPSLDGGVASAPTRIAGAAFRLLQQKEKNSFRIKETYTTRRDARDRRDRVSTFDRRASSDPDAARPQRAGSSRICENHCEMGISCTHESLCAVPSASP
jgi:hypothetical protein